MARKGCTKFPWKNFFPQLQEQAHAPTEIETRDPKMPASPVKNLRSLFEPSKRNNNLDTNCVVAYPLWSIAKEVPEEDENEDVANSQPKGPQVQAPLVQPMPILPQPVEWWTKMKERVDRYHGAVQKKFLTSNSDVDMDIDEDEELRTAFEGFAEHQNQLGRAMAVALFRGMELAQTTQTNQDAAESLHARELQDL